ncbi:MAG TPA: plastocyanin/azurin family copper-binding protein, partial [Actinomycetota bacterium]|nr:plastocyanin/azurin family copper-binding protein [Actinomycetota bacterium]
ARNVRFDPTTLTAQGGKVTVAVRNRDLFWHTFTVDAKPGTYRFYCRIPAHAAVGMHGTLVVR